MCSDVTTDVRRLITAMRSAMTPTPSGIVNKSDIVCSLLEFEHPLAAERPANAIREGAEVGTREVALIVARVEMVRDVEHLQADSGVVMKQPESLADLRVERHELSKAAGLVPRSHKIPVFIHHRQREPGPDLQHREYREAAR